MDQLDAQGNEVAVDLLVKLVQQEPLAQLVQLDLLEREALKVNEASLVHLVKLVLVALQVHLDQVDQLDLLENLD